MINILQITGFMESDKDALHILIYTRCRPPWLHKTAHYTVSIHSR